MLSRLIYLWKVSAKLAFMQQPNFSAIKLTCPNTATKVQTETWETPEQITVPNTLDKAAIADAEHLDYVADRKSVV